MSGKSLTVQAAESADALDAAQWRIAQAIEILKRYGASEDAEHKSWAIDQALRALAGVRYACLIKAHCAAGNEWSVGRAP